MTAGFRTEQVGRRARITLAAEPLNVLTTELLLALDRTLEALEERGTQVVVIESGDETAFSAGVDVADHLGERAAPMLEAVHGVVRRLWEAGFVSIAAVDGPALGGGCEIAAACDFVLATERAVFALPEIRLGVFPPFAVAEFPRLVGLRRATQMILTGDPLTAEEAARIGLITDVVPAENLLLRIEGLVGTLLRMSGSSLAEARSAIRTAWGPTREQALREVERHYLDSLMKTADAQEGLLAFLEKRPPEWSHR